MPKQGNDKLSRMRERIDEIDRELVSLLQERIEIARQVGAYKRERGIKIEDSEREKEVLTRVKKLSQDLEGDFLHHIYSRIILESKRAQRQGKIAILGPRGTYSEEAAYKFMLSPALILAGDLGEVFNLVTKGEVEFGVVPIENSLEGSVHLAQEYLIREEVSIYFEVILDINHHLLGRRGAKLYDIEEAISHPQALAQCRRTISELGVRTRNAPSTADAARMVKEEGFKNSAAIAPLASARLYDLKVLRENIQDIEQNQTRFLIISQGDHRPTGRDKTSVIFSLKDEPGTLYEVIKIFAQQGVNLTKIESRPTRRALGDYMFFIDFQGHREEERIRRILDKLENSTSFLKVLGSYPVAEGG